MAMNGRTKPKIVPFAKIPSKIYYSISEASEFTGVEPHVLRYWETKFSKLNPKRVGGNQRKYTRNDVELLYEIVHLLYQEGYTLDGAERKLRFGLQAFRAERDTEKESEPIISPQTPPQATEDAQDNVGACSDSQLQEIKKELQAILDLLG
jgi:DNA-binding transcriptional MerR regulator